MALTPEEVKRMEEQADLSDRFNRAADRYVAGNNPGLRAAEREQVLRGREADVFSAARQRRLDSQRMTAIADPGRYAPSVRQEALEWQRTGGLRAHELEVLRQQGDNDFRVAQQKRWGMREQGADAAGLNAEATKYGWDKQLEMEDKRQSGLTEREKMIGDREKGIEEIRGKNAQAVANINADSAYDVADRQGQTAVAVEREKGTQMAAANIREEQVLNWKQQHEKELAQMRLNNMIPDEREMRGLIILQQQPENKGKSIMQILKEFREASK